MCHRLLGCPGDSLAEAFVAESRHLIEQLRLKFLQEVSD